MSVNVVSEVIIERPRVEVAAFAGDPATAPSWYQNIASASVLTPPPLAVGSRITFVARFLGRRLEYTYEVTEYAPGERLVMATTDGPMAMETSYAWEDAGPAATRMTLRNRGEPGGLFRLATPLLEGAMRRANRKDLDQLKSLLEGPGDRRS